MISKPLPAHSFYHTCRYVAQKPGSELLLAEGVRGHEYKLMAEDFLNQQQLRATKEKACFHSILSFYPGEKPTDETMQEIAKEYLQELGIVNTQYAVVKHTDRAHLHLHIVANMVNNDGDSITDSWIGLRGKKAAQRLTEKYGLIPANGKNLDLTHLESLSQSEASKYKIYQAIAENLPLSRSLDDLATRLKSAGIDTQYKYKGQTQEKQGISFRIGNVSFKGSEVDRKYSLAGLQKALALQQKQRIEVFKKKIGHTLQLGQSSHQMKQSFTIKDDQLNADQKFGKAISGIIHALLKSEDTGGAAPYDLSQQAEKRRKKKKKRSR